MVEMGLVVLGLVAVLGGMVASLAGFGIGSLLTPTLALVLGAGGLGVGGFGLAVAAVSLPHLVATAWRLVPLWRSVDWGFLRGFGVASAAGSLAGAGLGVVLGGAWLEGLLGVLMVFVGSSGLAGWRFTIPERWGVGAGVLSGLFGGLVGNQGGVRSAAMLGSDLRKEAFVGTATATGVLVDLARVPVYLGVYGGELPRLGVELGVMTLGVVLGTVLGVPVLRRVPEGVFRKVVAGVILGVGVLVLGRVVLGLAG